MCPHNLFDLYANDRIVWSLEVPCVVVGTLTVGLWCHKGLRCYSWRSLGADVLCWVALEVVWWGRRGGHLPHAAVVRMTWGPPCVPRSHETWSPQGYLRVFCAYVNLLGNVVNHKRLPWPYHMLSFFETSSRKADSGSCAGFFLRCLPQFTNQTWNYCVKLNP